MEAGEEEEKKEDGRMGGEGKEEKRKEFKQSFAYMKRLKCQKPNQSQEQPRWISSQLGWAKEAHSKMIQLAGEMNH